MCTFFGLRSFQALLRLNQEVDKTPRTQTPIKMKTNQDIQGQKEGVNLVGEHKGVITIIIAVIVLFGLFVAFGQNVIGPLLDAIGVKFTNMVNSVFDSTNIKDPNQIVPRQ